MGTQAEETRWEKMPGVLWECLNIRLSEMKQTLKFGFFLFHTFPRFSFDIIKKHLINVFLPYININFLYTAHGALSHSSNNRMELYTLPLPNNVK